MTPDERALAARIEVAVWEQLSRRRWFGKHVECDEMDELESDLWGAITKAVQGP